MTFKVIDKKTGKEPTNRVIHNIAKKGYLMFMDIDQFFVGEDGSLVLADDCGNITYCDTERFEVIAEQEPKTEWIPVSKRLPKENGCYLVTIQAFGQHTFMKVVSFATNLSLIDKYDFNGKKQAGWYDYDSEYGHYELDDVIAWQSSPEPYKKSEGKK